MTKKNPTWTHQIDRSDLAFLYQVEQGDFPVEDFDHRAHLRLAYAYLVQHDFDTAAAAMRAALLGLLRHAGIDPEQKFHETLTVSWLMAVRHFMNRGPAFDSAESFLAQHPELLDTRIMLSHYSPEHLFSEAARKDFVEPDLERIPSSAVRND